MGFSIGTEALFWGLLSGVSLPLGALLGLRFQPGRRLGSTATAFGAGALLFALTIELFGHVPHHVEEHGIAAFFACAIGACLGGITFDVTNQFLNNRGAFLRRLSHARRHVARIRLRNTKRIMKELTRVAVLRGLDPEHMAQLIRASSEKHFKEGRGIFAAGEAASEVYFIVSGEVEILLSNGESSSRRIALLGPHEILGELGVLRDTPRSAEARALSDVHAYKILKPDFDEIVAGSPALQSALGKLVESRVHDLSERDPSVNEREWQKKILAHLARSAHTISVEDVVQDAETPDKPNAALAIWLGILIDGIPESLVIGMLAVSATGMSSSFIAGVFLANFPEAMSSAVSMKRAGMSGLKILFMWGSICVMTGIGAFIGAMLLSAHPTGVLFYFVLGIEALAAGAMLTMIAETMLPEAYEQGGAIVGLSTLAGFLTTLFVKVI